MSSGPSSVAKAPPSPNCWGSLGVPGCQADSIQRKLHGHERSRAKGRKGGIFCNKSNRLPIDTSASEAAIQAILPA